MTGPTTGWDELAEWWRGEVANDPAYADEVDPIFWDIVGSVDGLAVLDIGCGDGRVMAQLGNAASVLGVDGSIRLLDEASRFGETHQTALPSLAPVRDASVDLAIAVLVLEHLPSLGELFAEVARVVKPGGVFVTVVNHPLSTAPGSAPVVDPSDGEVLWRFGDYLSNGWHDEPVGDDTLRFYHRPLSVLLTAAATAGLNLERMIENGPPEASVERIPLLAGQRQLPRLAAVRWLVPELHSADG